MSGVNHDMQFAFMPGYFIMQKVLERHQARKNKLYYAFLDFGEVVRWDLRKLGVDEWLIRTVMTLYTEA